MSKSLQRIFILMLMGVGFAVFALYQITKGPDSDHVWLGVAYLVPSVAAFVALLKLPTKSTTE